MRNKEDQTAQTEDPRSRKNQSYDSSRLLSQLFEARWFSHRQETSSTFV